MIVVSLQYVYLVAHLPYVLMWIGLFLYFLHVRHTLVWMSFLCILGGPLSAPLFVPSYWTPESALLFWIGPFRFMIEDAINAFVFSGIISVMCQAMRSKVLLHDKMLIGGARYACLIVGVVSLPLVWLGINAIFATAAGFLLGAAYMIYRRRDLARVSLESGGFAVLVMAVGHTLAYLLIANGDEVVRRFWHFTYTEAWGKGGVLAVELIWAFSFGTLFGPLYAFARRMRYV